MKTFLSQNWLKISIVIIAVLLVMLGILFLKNAELEWQLVFDKSVPDVELINYLSFDSKDIVSGSVTGFVVFDDKEKQPRNFRQYIKLTALNSLDNDSKQLFSLTDIIKMDGLPPRYFDPVVLTVKNTSGDIITLADTENNLYFIDKKTNQVSMFDSTKDLTKLITSDSDFGKYIQDFLK